MLLTVAAAASTRELPTMSAERDEFKAAALADARQRAERGLLCGRLVDVPGSENDPRIVGLARSAVDEHNKNARLADAFMTCTGLRLSVPVASCQNTQLEFEKLVKVKEQGCGGRLYHLTIEAKDGDAKKLYEAKVWEVPWEELEGLVDLKPADC